jgi:2'-5' RNA ligase
MMNDQPEQQRLFFALWPEDDVRQAIAEYFLQTPQSRLRASTVRPENYHITLHFLGNVEAAMADCAARVAQSVQGRAFELTLDQPGHFYKSQVFWLGCRQVPPALLALQQQLGEALQTCGYQPETRPFAPHVTLMRKLRAPGDIPEVVPIHWPVQSFVLVESVADAEGVHYLPRQKYLLQPA